MRPPITIAFTYRFFTPLVVMTVLSMGSSSIIHGALARMEHPKLVLAAFAVAMSTHGVMGSPMWSAPDIALSTLRDRRSLRRMLQFLALLAGVLAVLYLGVALTPVGGWLFGHVLGGSPEVVRQARLALLVLYAEVPLLGIRAVGMALVILDRRTRAIPVTTVVRVISLIGFLTMLPLWLEGAVAGAAAFVLCILLETLTMLWVALPRWRALPEGEQEPPSLGALVRFAWPLMTIQGAEFGVPLVINLFLGRVARADLALAAFGVMNGLVRLLVGPVRNLTHVAQTLAHTEEERRVVLRFTAQVIGLFSALLAGLFLTPAGYWLLHSVLGLTPELTAYVRPAMRYALLIGLCWGLAALLRGLVTNTRDTRPVAFGSALRVVVVVGVGLTALPVIEGNGAIFAMLALTAAFAGEALLLAGWLRWRRP